VKFRIRSGAPASTGGRFAPVPHTETSTRLTSWSPGPLPIGPETPADGTWGDVWLTADDARALRNA
jgi:hypothetical protein